MFPVVIALVLLVAAASAIYLILKNMGEEGIEIAAPGSCKSGRCGVRCAPAEDAHDENPEETSSETEDVPPKKNT